MEREIFSPFDLPEDQRIYFAKVLININRIDTNANIQIITRTPFVQDDIKNIGFVSDKIRKINQIMPAIKTNTDLVLGKIIKKSLGMNNNYEDISELLNFLSKSNNPTKISDVLGIVDLMHHKFVNRYTPPSDSTEQEVLGASNHLVINIAATIYQNTTDERSKTVAKTYLLYFVAIQSIIVGEQTNSHLFAHYPDKIDLSTINKIVIAVKLDDLDAVKRQVVRELFEGHVVSPITDLGDGQYFSYSNPLPEE